MRATSCALSTSFAPSRSAGPAATACGMQNWSIHTYSSDTRDSPRSSASACAPVSVTAQSKPAQEPFRSRRQDAPARPPGVGETHDAEVQR